MPLINNAITFDRCVVKKIKETLTSAHFCASDWSKDDLKEIRALIREHYRNEQRLVCAYCANTVSGVSVYGATVEHIAPKSLYPQFMFEPKNLCVVCPDCNEIKRQEETFEGQDPFKQARVRRYPRSSNAFRIVHPHFDEYDAHILKRGRIYVGMSKKGDWTIYACGLNRRFFSRFGMSEEFVADAELIEEEADFFERS